MAILQLYPSRSQEEHRQLLVIGYTDGFQVWDLQDPTSAKESEPEWFRRHKWDVLGEVKHESR